MVHHLLNVLFQDRGMGRPYLSSQREVTLSPWLQWNPTSLPGGHLQLRTHLGVNNHLCSGTAHIQEPSSHLLAERFLELHEASRFETRVPDTGNSSSSVLQLQLLMRFARLLKAWSGLWAASPFTGQVNPQGTRITICNFFPHTCFFQAA